MGHKIFVSHKYKDSDVKELPGIVATWVGDYVDYIQNKVFSSTDNIYKGEKSDEDISNLSDDQIWEHLKDKIYDSTVTIVLVSPNMKEPYRNQKSQWIPQEISYSVKLTTRAGRTSQRNALLVVILPDKNGSYNYYDEDDLFPILKENIKNGYAEVIKWSSFILLHEFWIEMAINSKNSVSEDKIVKSL